MHRFSSLVEVVAPGRIADAVDEYDEREGEREGGEVPDGAATGECAICYAEYVVGAATFVTPPCGHPFHRSCLNRWTSMRRSCPYCHAPVPVVYDYYCWGEEDRGRRRGPERGRRRRLGLSTQASFCSV